MKGAEALFCGEMQSKFFPDAGRGSDLNFCGGIFHFGKIHPLADFWKPVGAQGVHDSRNLFLARGEDDYVDSFFRYFLEMQDLLFFEGRFRLQKYQRARHFFSLCFRREAVGCSHDGARGDVENV